jgi:hypothetical protein
MDSNFLGTRRGLAQVWKTFATWRKLESPNRAPPLTQKIADGWIPYAIDHLDLEFASRIALGFYGLFRTGELLQTRPSDFLLGPNNGIVSSTDTETGFRNAAKKMVSIEPPLALEVFRATCDLKREMGMSKVAISSKFSQCLCPSCCQV